VCEWLDESLRGSYGAVIESSGYVVCELMNYLRILPYVRDLDTRKFVDESLAKILSSHFEA
jgi:hypothetical protein